MILSEKGVKINRKENKLYLIFESNIETVIQLLDFSCTEACQFSQVMQLV